MTKKPGYFAGRLVLITGGSSGIGLALARQLSDDGARVWILARRHEPLERALSSLASVNGNRPGMLAADVSQWAQVEAAVGRITEEAGVPDLLINSAGVTFPGYLEKIQLEVYRHLMDINYFGTVHMVRAVMPGMLERGSGHIVNISSAGGFVTGPGYAAYSPTKFAVRGFSDALRSELRPRGLRVSLVYPPDTATPQLELEKRLKSPELRYLQEHASLGPIKLGLLTPEAVASAILRGVKRGSYVILPGAGNYLLYHITRLLGDLTYSVVDDEWVHARRESHQE
ncbi:MAG TPA: SDR family oxidoreductase [Anaerolineales bacterium]|nr:SDR family oxidoreductase [Anaerolineales bacterium]